MDNRYRNTGGQQDYRDRYGSRERQSEQFSEGTEYQQGEDRWNARNGQGWQSNEFDRGYDRGGTMQRADFTRAGSGYRSDTSSLDDYDRYTSEPRYGGATTRRDSYGSGSTFGAGRYGASRSATGFGSNNDGSDNYRSRGYGLGSYGAGTIPSRQYDADDRGFFDRASDEVMSWFGDDDAARRRRMDHREDHRGRGPENYTRSNERLLEDACERLTQDHLVDASKIRVECEDNEVTLNGTVDSRSAKRRAEDIVHDISGVKHVQNNLRVDSGEAYYSDTSGVSES